jgi:hypothetical protein
MARLSITIAHGLPPDAAQAKFHAAVIEARTHYLGWIDRLEWAEDGQRVTVAGPGFEVRCWCDERDVHVEGSIPFAWKLFENVLRSRIKHDIDRAMVTHHK